MTTRTRTTDDDDDADDDSGDDAFAECLGDLGVVFEDLDAEELPGQVAQSESDEFSYASPTESTATTEAFSLEVTEESAAAFAATVDDDSVATVAEFIDLMGAKSTTDCLLEAFEADMATESDDSDVPVEFDISVSNEADLGIGDRSVALGYELSAVFIVPIEFDAEVLLAQSGNDVVGVLHAVTGEPISEFDPRGGTAADRRLARRLSRRRGPPAPRRAPLASLSRKRGCR